MPQRDKGFDLGDYVEVKDRIKLFYELFGQGRLVTSQIQLTSEPDGKPRVIVEAKAYRSPDDPLPGVGWSWLELPGTTPYTRGSEIENAETSAWGRAIGSLGILIDRSIASANEVANKSGQPVAGSTPPAAVPAAPTPAPSESVIGTAEVGKPPSDFELRQTPDGPGLSFRLTEGRSGFKVVAKGPLATSLAAVKPIGERVECWGTWSDEQFTPKGKDRPVTYRVLHLERIKGADWTLPADEAASFPLFDAEDDARINAALDAA